MNDKDWRPPIGTRVLIVGRHPHAGKSGRVIRYDRWMGSAAIAIQCDDGTQPGVAKPENIKILKIQEAA